MARSTINPDAVIRSYCSRLDELIAAVKTDRLSEEQSLALVEHIINNRSTAAYLMSGRLDHEVGLPC
ncbi:MULTISPECIES: hypothetical protein [Mycobacteroides]|uniref:Uncharacterized protein n=1 Tax=Mycobacteroides immunogenum TaxID=83262 RepID=A0A179VGE0_9MYCO|nr:MULTISPECIES: hypothetical protein [Mycobacteroides]OAT69336.1 hypothetical protein AWB85_21465 [Mycobacteroides immunogenum]SKT85482.1 Uncharacterised protein [Mycobacteroides abscessus subsp. massiliense]SKU05241.1 Uncharacterised protein [Mycobacteroides abscessus subsp. massiliense]